MSAKRNEPLRITESSAVLSNAASTVLLAANPRRLYAEIINSSDVGIWLSLSGTAVIGQGIYLGPNGFSYVINFDLLWKGQVSGIAASGAGKVAGIIEGQ